MIDTPAKAGNALPKSRVPDTSGISALSEDKIPIKRMVEEEFGVGHVMVRIAESESSFSESAANPNSTARGVFQILVGTFNDPYYGCTGDRHEAKDNIECARKIYEKSGTVPWNSSRSSWGYN